MSSDRPISIPPLPLPPPTGKEPSVSKATPKRSKRTINIPRRNSAAQHDYNPISSLGLRTSNTGIITFSAGNVYYNTNPEGAELINNGQFYTKSSWSENALVSDLAFQ